VVPSNSEFLSYKQDIDLRTSNSIHPFPFVKWAGGKTQLLSKIRQFIPTDFKRYFEPFLGGAALFFYLNSNRNYHPFKAFLTDINTELINAYLVVEKDIEPLIQVLESYQKEFKKTGSPFYYNIRDNVEKYVTNKIEQTARFIFLNKTCYNGLYRVNSQGIFNVPIGRYNNPLICDSQNLRNVSLALQKSRAIIKASDYKDVLLENAEEGDFIYLDPPYNPMSSTAKFTSYTNTGFNSEDQQELANIFRILTDRKCMLLLSNSNTLEVRKLYSDSDYKIMEVDVLRSINSNASRRVGHRELLIRNFEMDQCLLDAYGQ
jgi:DNA adenine methylase